MKNKSLIVAIWGMCSATAYAADASTAPTVGQMLDASGINVQGYVDMAYNKMDSTGLFVNAPAGTVSGGLAGNSHIFDTQGAQQGKNFSSFNLHQAALIVSKQPKQGVGGYVNMTAGQDAATIASTGLGNNGTSDNSSHTFDLTQVYVSYATGPLTVIAGKFATLAGAELITSPSNKNYSRAWMFGWGPYTHTGVRATYAASDMVTLIAGINNGWDQVNSTTGSKTGELSLVLTPTDNASLATTYYQGKENAVVAGTRKYLDMVGNLDVTDHLNFAFDYANGSQGNANLPGGLMGTAKWDSLAVYANYKFEGGWRTSYRHEAFNDRDGYRSGLIIGGAVTGQRLNSDTLTVGYAVDKSLELRGEVRRDKSTQNAFLQSNGTGKNSQTAIAVEAVYQFGNS